MKKLGFVISVAAIAGFAGAVFAEQPDPTPGEINKVIKESCGTPGQNVFDLPANEFAKLRNQARKSGNAFGCIILEQAGAPD
jgi:hypothetical protein